MEHALEKDPHQDGCCGRPAERDQKVCPGGLSSSLDVPIQKEFNQEECDEDSSRGSNTLEGAQKAFRPSVRVVILLIHVVCPASHCAGVDQGALFGVCPSVALNNQANKCMLVSSYFMAVRGKALSDSFFLSF